MIDVSTRIAGRYRVDARLGGGGMADVYDAYDEVLNRPVAVKLLRGIDDAGAARRFAEEIRLTARVNHPNIVSLFDAGEHEGSPFLVLERVSGGTLAGEMATGPMPPQRVAEIGEQLASALSHSHAAGIVHRDVKPTNILISDDGSVRLADFGIAVTATATRLTVAGSIAGSAGYVSPEQVLGTGAGAPSDIYALGLVLLECLTGAPPWSGTTVEVALARLASDPFLPPSLSPEWTTLLRSMTARDPEDRPPIDLVGHALWKLAIDESFDQALFPLPAPPPDRRIPALAAVSLVVLLVSGFMTLTSNVTPNMAVAHTAPTVNVPAANAILEPAANAPAAPLTAEVLTEAPERARQRREPARKTAKAQASRRDAGATQQTAGADSGGSAGVSAGGSGGGSGGESSDGLDVSLPDVPQLGGSTAGAVPDVTRNETVRDTVDSVTNTTTKAKAKAKKKADAQERVDSLRRRGQDLARAVRFRSRAK